MKVKKYFSIVLTALCLTSSIVSPVSAKSKYKNVPIKAIDIGIGGHLDLKVSGIDNKDLTSIGCNYYWVRHYKNHDKCLKSVLKDIKHDKQYSDADDVTAKYSIDYVNK